MLPPLLVSPRLVHPPQSMPKAIFQKCKCNYVHTALPPETAVLETVQWPISRGKQTRVPGSGPHPLPPASPPFPSDPTCPRLLYSEHIRLLLSLPVFALCSSLNGFPHLVHQAHIYSSFQTRLSITFPRKSCLTSLVPVGFVDFLLGVC